MAKKQRKRARSYQKIRHGIDLLMRKGRPGMQYIHLLRCDFEKVKKAPGDYGCTLQSGQLVRNRPQFNTLIQVVPIDDE